MKECIEEKPFGIFSGMKIVIEGGNEVNDFEFARLEDKELEKLGINLDEGYDIEQHYTFREYQKLSQATAVYPRHDGFNLAYPVLGLTGEAGEVANQIKKIFRDDNGILTQERKDKLVDEISDVLWYIAALCKELDVRLEDVAKYNIEKLRKRYETKKNSGV